MILSNSRSRRARQIARTVASFGPLTEEQSELALKVAAQNHAAQRMLRDMTLDLDSMKRVLRRG